MKPNGVTDEQLKMRAFPFSLKDAARDWLYYLPPGSIDTWLKMKKAFLEKYFPASRASQLKNEISNVEQREGKTMYEYWERFKRLCGACPYHGYEEQDLVMYFCGGLSKDDARMVHAASGGGIVNKNPTDAMVLITELAESSREFDRRPSRRGVSAMGSSYNNSLEEKVDSLTSLMRDMMMGKKVARVCGICSTKGHISEHCPQMREERTEDVNAAGYMEPPQRRWDPYSNSYNPGWREHPNFKWGNRQGSTQTQFPQSNHSAPSKSFVPRPLAQSSMPSPSPPQTNSSNASMSTDDMIRALVTNQSNFQASVA
ncbi:hypothetical protein vseg_020934 [Gypsophila vaccaria]